MQFTTPQIQVAHSGSLSHGDGKVLEQKQRLLAQTTITRMKRQGHGVFVIMRFNLVGQRGPDINFLNLRIWSFISLLGSQLFIERRIIAGIDY